MLWYVCFEVGIKNVTPISYVGFTLNTSAVTRSSALSSSNALPYTPDWHDITCYCNNGPRLERSTPAQYINLPQICLHHAAHRLRQITAWQNREEGAKFNLHPCQIHRRVMVSLACLSKGVRVPKITPQLMLSFYIYFLWYFHIMTKMRIKFDNTAYRQKRSIRPNNLLICLILNDYNYSALSQTTLDIDPVLFWCWAIVYNNGPALKQHWGNVSWVGDDVLSLVRRGPSNAGLMLGHSLRRLLTIKTTLD